MSVSLERRLQHRYCIYFDDKIEVIEVVILATSTSFRHLFGKSFLIGMSCAVHVMQQSELRGSLIISTPTCDLRPAHSQCEYRYAVIFCQCQSPPVSAGTTFKRRGSRATLSLAGTLLKSREAVLFQFPVCLPACPSG